MANTISLPETDQILDKLKEKVLVCTDRHDAQLWKNFQGSDDITENFGRNFIRRDEKGYI